MLKRCLYKSELQTKALRAEAVQFQALQFVRCLSFSSPDPLSTLFFVQGSNLSTPCYPASTCAWLMESLRMRQKRGE